MGYKLPLMYLEGLESAMEEGGVDQLTEFVF